MQGSRTPEIQCGERIPIRLDLGSPDYPPPQAALGAVANLLKKAKGGYASPQGLPELRCRLAEIYSTRVGERIGPDQILITTGASGAITAVLAALKEQVKEQQFPLRIALPDPGYPAYTQIAKLIGWQPCYYPCPAEGDYLPSKEAFSRLVK